MAAAEYQSTLTESPLRVPTRSITGPAIAWPIE